MMLICPYAHQQFLKGSPASDKEMVRAVPLRHCNLWWVRNKLHSDSAVLCLPIHIFYSTPTFQNIYVGIHRQAPKTVLVFGHITPRVTTEAAVHL